METLVAPQVRASFRTARERARSLVLPHADETGCAGSFERGKTDSDVLLRGGFSSGSVGWAFHGRATPDFEPGRGLGLSAHYQPGTLNALVNHRSARVCCRDFSPRREIPPGSRGETTTTFSKRRRRNESGWSLAVGRGISRLSREIFTRETYNTYDVPAGLAFYGSILLSALPSRQGKRSPGRCSYCLGSPSDGSPVASTSCVFL